MTRDKQTIEDIRFGTSYPIDLKGRDIEHCRDEYDTNFDTECVQQFQSELARRKEESMLNQSKAEQHLMTALANHTQVERVANATYDEALLVKPDLANADLALTSKQKLEAINFAFTKLEDAYTSAQTEAQKHEGNWGGKSHHSPGGWYNHDPQLPHCAGCHGELNTERRNLIWRVVRKENGAAFPSDLSAADISTTCKVSPWSQGSPCYGDQHCQAVQECSAAVTNELALRAQKQTIAKHAKTAKENFQSVVDAAKSTLDNLVAAEQSLSNAEQHKRAADNDYQTLEGESAIAQKLVGQTTSSEEQRDEYTEL